MASYRLYRIDGAGKIASAEWLEATDDDHASKLARERAPDGIVEVWERNRLVARLGRREQSSDN